MALWSAPGVPPAVVAKMRDATLKAMQSREIRQKIEDLGMEVGSPATERRAFRRRARILRTAGQAIALDQLQARMKSQTRQRWRGL
ncbi:hypothetical protein ACU4GD_02170 [Cupriavidus basilensis]